MAKITPKIETVDTFPSTSSNAETAQMVGGPWAMLVIYSTKAVGIELLTSPRGELGAGEWQQEAFMASTEQSGPRVIVRKWIMGVRFRSWVEAEPSTVSIEAIPIDELFLSQLAGAS